jgi:hypothetical protein
MRRAAQGLDAVSGLKVGRRVEFVHGGGHRVTVQNACNVVGHDGGDLTTASGGKLGKERGGNLAGDVRERVAVEEQERRLAMTLLEEV